jgi:hypothetical protein
VRANYQLLARGQGKVRRCFQQEEVLEVRQNVPPNFPLRATGLDKAPANYQPLARGQARVHRSFQQKEVVNVRQYRLAPQKRRTMSSPTEVATSIASPVTTGSSVIRADGRNPLAVKRRILPSLGRSSNATTFRASAANRCNDNKMLNVAVRVPAHHLKVVAAEPVAEHVADRKFCRNTGTSSGKNPTPTKTKESLWSSGIVFRRK